MIWLWLLLGCEPAEVQFLPDLWNQDQWDTGSWDDSGPGGGSSRVEIWDGSVAWDCNGANTAWELSVQSTAAAGGGSLHLFGDTEWTEAHSLLLVDVAVGGSRDAYAVGPLLEGVDESAFIAGSNTTFSCATGSPTAVIVLDSRLGNVADCVVIGAHTPTSSAFVTSEELLPVGCRTLQL